MPAFLQAIESGICKENTIEFKDACHDFRGMLLTMEMHHAASRIRQMESLADGKRFKEVSEVYRSLKDEIAFTIEYLKKAV